MPALRMFTVISEGKSDSDAFAQAQKSPLLAGRVSYQLMDPTTVFPSDKHALSRAEDVFGVQPQADKVYIAGAHTNTVWALRIYSTVPGVKRLLFFGLYEPR